MSKRIIATGRPDIISPVIGSSRVMHCNIFMPKPGYCNTFSKANSLFGQVELMLRESEKVRRFNQWVHSA